jgi:hypothetical protein
MPHSILPKWLVCTIYTWLPKILGLTSFWEIDVGAREMREPGPIHFDIDVQFIQYSTNYMTNLELFTHVIGGITAISLATSNFLLARGLLAFKPGKRNIFHLTHVCEECQRLRTCASIPGCRKGQSMPMYDDECVFFFAGRWQVLLAITTPYLILWCYF